MSSRGGGSPHSFVALSDVSSGRHEVREPGGSRLGPTPRLDTGSELLLTPALLSCSASEAGRATPRAKRPSRSPFAGLAGWTPVAYKSVFEPGETGDEPLGEALVGEDATQHLSSNMVDTLNSMFSFMTHALTRERASHSSNISMMMRRVDKDLKDTYKTVQEICSSLTKQLVDLAKEVNSSRAQVKSIQEKYQEARNAAEAQAQYVSELEAVLDGQCAGITETMRRLTEKAAKRQQALARQTEEYRRRETSLRRDCERLREELRRYKFEEKLVEGEVLPPVMPEMPASWTLRSPVDTGSAGFRGVALETFREEDEEDLEDEGAETTLRAGSKLSSRGASRVGSKSVDIVGAVLAHSDADRAVSRSKSTSRKPGIPPRFCATPGVKRKRTNKEFLELEERAVGAEKRCGRLFDLVSFASSCLGLLRDVFMVLRTKRMLLRTTTGESVLKGGDSMMALASPEEALGDIVHLFHKHIPTLTCLPEVIRALGKEAEEGPPPMAGLFDDGSIESSR